MNDCNRFSAFLCISHQPHRFCIMGRPKKSNVVSFTDRLELRIHTDDKEEIEARAKEAGLSVSEYVRLSALSCEIIQKTRTDIDFRLVYELNKIGVNLNQIAKAMNSHGGVPDELIHLQKRIDDYLDKIISNDLPDF